MKTYAINIVWTTDDFEDCAPKSTLLERKAALILVKDSHDASLGVSWENLEQAMDIVREMSATEVKELARSSDLYEYEF